MNATWRLLTLLSVLPHAAEPRCSDTSYYKNCWIRRFPGIYIDVEESLRRGAQLLKFYREDTALKFSCNLAIFHYDATQESVNCFHLHCPTLESCILRRRSNVVLYNVTKGVDPDLLVFGKYFNTNVRVLPHHYSRSNASDPLPPDKRQFIHPRPRPVLPAPTPQPVSTEPSKTTLAAVNAREPTDMATTSAEQRNMGTMKEPSNVATTTEPSNTEARTKPSEITQSNMATSTHFESGFTTITPLKTDDISTQASRTSQTSSGKHINGLSTTLPTPLLSNLASETPTNLPIAPTSPTLLQNPSANLQPT
ncbi:hypothetical protein WMY93_023376 [Mugilogobius chulae]|uniref:Seven cysteines N-terminal domain-containing protein n=1 Tax=Mugilogobius chulae TaxID=88201 RepID=A0AAW0NEL6_9GOBI